MQRSASISGRIPGSTVIALGRVGQRLTQVVQKVPRQAKQVWGSMRARPIATSRGSSRGRRAPEGQTRVQAKSEQRTQARESGTMTGVPESAAPSGTRTIALAGQAERHSPLRVQ